MKTTCQLKNRWFVNIQLFGMLIRQSVSHWMTRKKNRMQHDFRVLHFPNHIKTHQRTLFVQCYIPGQYSANEENQKKKGENVPWHEFGGFIVDRIGAFMWCTLKHRTYNKQKRNSIESRIVMTLWQRSSNHHIIMISRCIKKCCVARQHP